MDWRQILVLLLIFVPLERLLPHRREQGIFRRHWVMDSVYLLANGLLIRFLFLGLLALPASRFTASELLDLLGVPAVPRALELDAAALERIARWFEDAGVRWGEDEDARVRAGVGRWREHSIAFGFDPLVMLLCGESSIRDVIAFPKTQKASCLLTNAPSEPVKAQLDELHLRVKLT
jgi:hypothetical protein